MQNYMHLKDLSSADQSSLQNLSAENQALQDHQNFVNAQYPFNLAKTP